MRCSCSVGKGGHGTSIPPAACFSAKERIFIRAEEPHRSSSGIPVVIFVGGRGGMQASRIFTDSGKIFLYKGRTAC